MWNGDITVQTVSYTTQELYLFVQVNKSLPPFIITSTYVRPTKNFKSIFLEILHNFYTPYNGPLLVLGDLNDIAHESKNFGGRKPCIRRLVPSIKELVHVVSQTQGLMVRVLPGVI